MTVFNHFRKIKRMKAKEWSALVKKYSKDSVQKCREVMRRIDTTRFGLEESDGEVSLDGHGLPQLLDSPPARRLGPRASDETELSLDDAGLPKILACGQEPKHTSILDKLQLMKKPAAASHSPAKDIMKKPAAKSMGKVTKVMVNITRKKGLKLRPTGCSKCRGKPGCTPSCWKVKGCIMI